MKTIHKYPLDIVGEQSKMLPKDAKIISAGNQDGVLTVWAEVDPEADREQRTFHVIGTGNPMPFDTKHMESPTFLGTVQIPPFVWHVYYD